MKQNNSKKVLAALLVVPMVMNGILAHANEPVKVKDNTEDLFGSQTEHTAAVNANQEYENAVAKYYNEKIEKQEILNSATSSKKEHDAAVQAKKDYEDAVAKYYNEKIEKQEILNSATSSKKEHDAAVQAKKDYEDAVVKYYNEKIEKQEELTSATSSKEEHDAAVQAENNYNDAIAKYYAEKSEETKTETEEDAPVKEDVNEEKTENVTVTVAPFADNSSLIESLMAEKEAEQKVEVNTMAEAEAAVEEAYGEEIDFAEFNAEVELAKVTTLIYEQTVLLNHIETYYRLTFGSMITAPRNNATSVGVAKEALEKQYPGVALTKEFLAKEYKSVYAAREKNVQKKLALEAYIDMAGTHNLEVSTTKVPRTSDPTNVISLLALLGVSVGGIYTSKKYLNE